MNFAFFLKMKINNRIKVIPKGEKIKGNSFVSKYVFINNSI